MTEVLSRSVPFELREDAAADGNTLFGHAAVFNSPTRIDSWEGTFDEEIAPGAFKRSLGERTPVLQFDHGKHPMVGSIPIGYFRTLAEGENGLEVDAPLHDNWLVQPVRDAIKSKAIPGMSFRFSVVKDEWRDASGKEIPADQVERALMRSDRNDPASIPKRILRDMDLYELGPVVFPAYTDTDVGVRSRELVTLLSDPQVRAEAAALLVGTPTELGDADGAFSEAREAANVDAEPQEATPDKHTPSSITRNRALILEGVISDG